MNTDTCMYIDVYYEQNSNLKILCEYNLWPPNRDTDLLFDRSPTRVTDLFGAMDLRVLKNERSYVT